MNFSWRGGVSPGDSGGGAVVWDLHKCVERFFLRLGGFCVVRPLFVCRAIDVVLRTQNLASQLQYSVRESI